VCEGVNREVFSQGRGGDLCQPVQGEVDRGEAFRMMSGRVLGPKGREGGEGRREPSRGRVRVWGGAGHPEGGQSSTVPAVGDHWVEAGFAGQDRGGGGVEVVRRPSLDSVPEAIHAPERSVGRV